MIIGVDLGGSHIAVGIINEDGKIIAKNEKDIIINNIENENLKIENYITDNIILLINDTLRQIGAPLCVISKIGIASPGKVENGIIKNLYNLGIKQYNLAQEISNYYQVEINIQNDAKCAALAEKKYGALQEYRNAVFICLGTGIGGATFINDKLLDSKTNMNSEYGHMIIDKDGNQCKCGNKGCFETYCSMKAFKKGIIQLLDLDENISSQEILELLTKNIKEENINNYIDQYIDNLILGISNICNIIEPEAICIGGSFVYYERILYTRLLEKIQLNKYKFIVPKIVLAKLRNDAGIIGSSLI